MDELVKHTVEYVLSPHWLRAGSFTDLYVEMAFEYYVKHCIAASKRIPRPSIDEDPTEHAEREKAYEISAIKSVVFAGLAVEAAVYEIAATHLGEKFVKDHLERIEVFAKWALVPRLICGKSLDPGGPGMNSLKELIQARNLLVHHKSSPFPSLGGEHGEEASGVVNYDPKALHAVHELTEKLKAENARMVSCAKTGLQAIMCLSLELEDLLGVSLPGLGHYSAGWISLSGEPEAPIQELIYACRKKVADRKAKVTKPQ